MSHGDNYAQSSGLNLGKRGLERRYHHRCRPFDLFDMIYNPHVAGVLDLLNGSIINVSEHVVRKKVVSATQGQQFRILEFWAKTTIVRTIFFDRLYDICSIRIGNSTVGDAAPMRPFTITPAKVAVVGVGESFSRDHGGEDDGQGKLHLKIYYI